MLLNVFTIIVFIAEIIIAITLIRVLLKLDKKVLDIDETIVKLRPGIKDVGSIIRKISAQYVEFSEDFVLKIIKKRDESIFNQLNKILVVVLLLKINSKFIRKVMRSKQFKLLSKGLSLLKYVV